MMRKNISVCAIILAIMCALASCGGSDSYSSSLYDDAAITSFYLGSFKTATTVKAHDGVTDSTVYTTYSGSDYAICIDQLKHEIYNTDSLPYGAIMKMKATVSSLNSGVVILEDYTDIPDDTKWVYYYSSDSIDFSTLKRFRVISTDGTNIQDYKVDIQAHKEESGKFVWNNPVEVAAFKNSTVLKGLATSEGMYILCSNGLYKSTDEGKTWGSPIGSAEGKSIIAKGNDVYVLGNTLYCNGTAVSGADVTGLKFLVAATSHKLYAVTTSGQFTESSDGKSWEASPIGLYEDDDNIPTEDICYVLRPSTTNSNHEIITVIGNKSNITTEKSDTCAVVWNKTVRISDGKTVDNWTETESPVDENLLPCLSNLSSCGYVDTWLLAIGGAPKNSAISNTPYDRVYVSYAGDDGITWSKVSGFTLPVTPSAPALLMSDYKKQYFYLVDPATGKVYRGMLTNAIWTNN